MASNAEMVGEFREIVDGIIARQVEEAQTGPLRSSWPGMREVAKTAGMIFTSLNGKQGRYNSFPFYEQHIWSVSPVEMYKTDRFTGSIALVAVQGKDEQLTRFWSFNTDMQMIHVDTEKVLDKAEQIEAALNWVKSPHIYPGNLKELGVLDPEEIGKVAPELDRIAEDAASMYEDLAHLAAQRRRPMPDIGPIA